MVFSNTTLSYLLPLRKLLGAYCVCCQKPSNRLVCVQCMDSIARPSVACEVCGIALVGESVITRCKECVEKPPAFETLYSIGTYQDSIAELILAAKLGKQVAAIAALREILRHYLEHDVQTQNYLSKFSGYSVLGIPTPKSRLLHRGFNLPHWLAKDIAQYCHLPLMPSSAVKLPIFVSKQAKLSKDKRQKNKHFYQINHKIPAKILIVDDICTTGATLHELSKQLRENGAKSIAAYVVSRSQLG